MKVQQYKSRLQAKETGLGRNKPCEHLNLGHLAPRAVRPQASGVQATQSMGLNDSAPRLPAQHATGLHTADHHPHPCQIRNVPAPPRTAALLSALSQQPFLPDAWSPSSLLTQRPPQVQLPSPTQTLWSQLPPSMVHSLDPGQLAWIQELQPFKHKPVSAIHSGTQTPLLGRPSHLDLRQEPQ